MRSSSSLQLDSVTADTNEVPAAQYSSSKWKVNAVNKVLVGNNASVPLINAGGEPVVSIN